MAGNYTGNGAGFLTDYSNLAAAGSAFQGFADSYQKAQDSQMKRQEHEAQMEAVKSKMQREKDQSELDMMKQGVKRGASGLEEIPLSPRQRSDNLLKVAGEGNKITSTDEMGNPTAIGYDPDTAKAKAIEASKFKISSGADFKRENQDRLHDAMDRREHEKVLARINANPGAKQKLGQMQGLDNALSIITDADHITPEQIHEFQQAIRGNMGMKGQSGVGEREETYFKSVGLNAARFKEFLTSDPASISKDSNLINHFKQLAKIERDNINKQYDRSLSAASSGHTSMYERRPDLKQDLKDAMDAQQGQTQGNEAAPIPPQGLVQPQSRGMLSGLLSPIFGSQADAAPPITEPDVLDYARKHGITPEAAKAIKVQRTGK